MTPCDAYDSNPLVPTISVLGAELSRDRYSDSAVSASASEGALPLRRLLRTTEQQRIGTPDCHDMQSEDGRCLIASISWKNDIEIRLPRPVGADQHVQRPQLKRSCARIDLNPSTEMFFKTWRLHGAAYRSSSAAMMFRLPSTATTSLSVWPRMRWGNMAKWMNEGGRQRAR